MGADRVSSSWWGEFAFSEEEERYWQIGPLKMWIYRSACEWRVSCERTGDALEDALTIADKPDSAPGPKASVTRFGFRRTADRIGLIPALADRAVNVNPSTPFLLPPGEELTVFMSSPLWLRLVAGKHLLYEEPIYRPSDTWFGPSTRVGELCYASRTRAWLRLEDLLIRPQRALSAVRIRNRAKTNLPLERVKLPVVNLSLFATPDRHLWTEGITLDREEDGEMASVRLEKEPPAAAHGATLVSGPRERAEKHTLIRAFGSLLAFGGLRANDRLAE